MTPRSHLIFIGLADGLSILRHFAEESSPPRLLEATVIGEYLVVGNAAVIPYPVAVAMRDKGWETLDGGQSWRIYL